MKKLILLIMFIVLLENVIAIDINTGLEAHYSFDINGNDDFGDHDMTGNNGVGVQSGLTVLGNATYCDGVDDDWSTIANPFDNLYTIGQFSYSFWLLANSSWNEAGTSMPWSNEGYHAGRGEVSGSGKTEYSVNGGSNWATETNSADGTWRYYTVVYNGTVLGVYVDGNLQGSSVQTDSDLGSQSRNFRICSQHNGNSEQRQYVDEFSVYNRTLTDEDIEALYNSGNGCNPVLNASGCTIGGGSPSASLTLNHNLYSQGNYSDSTLNITWNGTLSDHNTDIFNCTVVETDTNYTLNQVNITLLNSFLYNFSEVEATYNFSIDCINYETNDKVGIFNYLVDRIDPIVVTTNVENGPTYLIDEIKEHTFMINDTNLFAFQLNYTDSNGNIYNSMQYFEENITGTGYEIIVNLTNSDSGNYTIDLGAWDSHHLNGVLLKSYAILDKNVVNYDGVKFYCEDVKEMKFNQYDFKVSPEPIFNKANKNQICYYDLKDFIGVGNRDGFKNHYVSIALGKWIDENELEVEVSEIGNSLLKFNFTFDKPTISFKANSIGDLNYIHRTWYYTVVNEQVYWLEQIYNQEVLQTSDIEEIKEAINMIPVVFLWTVTTLGGLWLIKRYFMVSGILTYFFSFVFDLMLSSHFMTKYMGDYLLKTYAGFSAYFILIFIAGWVFIKFVIGSYYVDKIKGLGS